MNVVVHKHTIARSRSSFYSQWDLHLTHMYFLKRPFKSLLCSCSVTWTSAIHKHPGSAEHCAVHWDHQILQRVALPLSKSTAAHQTRRTGARAAYPWANAESASARFQHQRSRRSHHTQNVSISFSPSVECITHARWERTARPSDFSSSMSVIAEATARANLRPYADGRYNADRLSDRKAVAAVSIAGLMQGCTD